MASFRKKPAKPRSNSPVAGARFGLLTSVRFARMAGTGANQVWLFRCDCGREFRRNYTAVKTGRYADCGCRPPTRMQRIYLFRERFKVSGLEAELLAVRVEGACDVCDEPESKLHPKTGVVQFLCVDHCHETGQVRGVLCAKCNHAEGLLRGLTNAIKMVAYLENANRRASEVKNACT